MLKCDSCDRTINSGLKTENGCIWCDVIYWKEKQMEEKNHECRKAT
jgi:hypothetical protein